MIGIRIVAGLDSPSILRARAKRLTSGVQRAIMQVVVALQRYIITTKLQGSPLGERSSKLIRNIVTNITTSGDEVIGEVTIGAGAPYGEIHEFGGTFTVREHFRINVRNSGRHLVRSHRIHFPERSFMRSSLNETREEIRQRIIAEPRAAIQGLLSGEI